MALTKTTLSGGLNATDLTFNVVSVAGATVGQMAKIENEYIGAVLSVEGTAVTIRGRGWNGTKGVPHNTSAPVTFAQKSGDWTASDHIYDPQNMPDEVFINANTSIVIPVRDTRYIITKGSAAAITLGAPSPASDGVVLEFIGGSDFAHVVTVATAWGDGTSGGSTVLTSPPFAGSSARLMALKGAYVLLGGGTNSGPWVYT